MMIPETLTSNSNLSRNTFSSRLRMPSMALCLFGLLGSAVACSDSIDEDQDPQSSRPTTVDSRDNGTNARDTTTTENTSAGTTNAGDDESDPIGVSLDDDDDDRVVGGNRRAGGGSGRSRTTQTTSDAGDVDAGDVDAGDVDAGDVDVDVDAGDVDVDAGDAG